MHHLAGRSLVVVLDNCEHVIDQAAALAEALVGAVPGLRLIATSREPLGVPGEVLVPVAGLAPTGRRRALRRSGSGGAARLRADGRTGAVINDICRRLDGLPLAVELAAARLRALPLATLAERLDDRFRLLPGAPARPCPASKPFGRWWTGATTCCSRTNAACSPGCRSSPAAAS